MSTTPQRCPCGSGKALGRCCTEAQLARRRLKLFIISALCVVVAGGLAALTFSMAPKRPEAAATVAGTVAPGATVIPSSTAIPSTENPLVPNPRPWQYDPRSDKHYHPGHAHWHLGPPPPEDQRNGTASTTSSPFTTSSTVTGGTSTTVTGGN